MEPAQRRAAICPSCRKLISQDELRCPYCHTIRPGGGLKTAAWRRWLDNAGAIVKCVIYVNVGMFVVAVLMHPRTTNFSINPLTFLSPDSRSLLILGATGAVPIDQFHRWWTLLAANYLHAGILHILFNMMAFRQISPLVTTTFGVSRMFVIYTAGGTLGYAVSYLAGVRFTIGASAAVCALMGAAFYYGRSRGGNFGRMVYRQIGGWVLGIFLFGIFVPGINNWGHGGGLVCGALIGWLLGYQERRRERFWHQLLAAGCIVATAVVLGWAVASGIAIRLNV